MIREQFRADWPVHLMLIGYCLLSVAIVAISQQELWVLSGRQIIFLLLVNCIIFPIAIPLLEFAFRAVRSMSPIQAFRTVYNGRRIARLLAGIILLQSAILFLGGFTAVKANMAHWRGGFPLDGWLADLDRALHWGMDPLAALSQCCVGDSVTSWVIAAYMNGWFLTWFGSIYLFATLPAADRLRARFFTCYLLTWSLGGNLIAMAMMSGGPVFFEAITGDAARFGPFMAHIADNAVAAPAAGLQGYLWELYTSGEANVGAGISAFPSMHVSSVVLLACFAFEINRIMGWYATAYAAAIQFGSVYLGWHYAVDGYFSILMTVAIYFAVRRLAGAAKGLQAGAVSDMPAAGTFSQLPAE